MSWKTCITFCHSRKTKKNLLIKIKTCKYNKALFIKKLSLVHILNVLPIWKNTGKLLWNSFRGIKQKKSFSLCIRSKILINWTPCKFHHWTAISLSFHMKISWPVLAIWFTWQQGALVSAEVLCWACFTQTYINSSQNMNFLLLSSWQNLLSMWDSFQNPTN